MLVQELADTEHLNIDPTAVDVKSKIHSTYRDLLLKLYKEDPRPPKAIQSVLIHIYKENNIPIPRLKQV